MSLGNIPQSRWIRIGRAILLLGLAIGMIGALCQFASGRSLWLDEAKLALNVLDRDFGELIKPLDREQAAPIGYLWIQKAIVSIFGPNEMSFRLLSLVSYFLSIWLLFTLAKRWFNNRWMHLMSATALAATYAMVYHGSEAKQYAFDVCVVLLLTQYLLKEREYGLRQLVLLSLAGAVGVFCSHITTLILPLLAIVLLYNRGLKKGEWSILFPIAVWAGAFGLFYIFFVKGHPTQAILSNYWSAYFMPMNFLGPEPYEFVFRILWREIVAFQTGFGRTAYVLLPIIGLGVVAGIRAKNYLPVFLLLGMVTGHFALSALGIYPFAGRLALYLSPWIALFLCLGISSLAKLVFRDKSWGYALQAVGVLLLLYPTLSRLPIKREELKPALAILEEKQISAKAVLVYPYSKPALEFYGKTQYAGLFEEVEYLKREEAFSSQVKSISTNELWFLGSHFQLNTYGVSHELEITRRLRAEGFEVAEEWNFQGAALYHLKRPK